MHNGSGYPAEEAFPPMLTFAMERNAHHLGLLAVEGAAPPATRGAVALVALVGLVARAVTPWGPRPNYDAPSVHKWCPGAAV